MLCTIKSPLALISPKSKTSKVPKDPVPLADIFPEAVILPEEPDIITPAGVPNATLLAK